MTEENLYCRLLEIESQYTYLTILNLLLHYLLSTKIWRKFSPEGKTHNSTSVPCTKMFGWGKKEKKSDFVIEEDDDGEFVGVCLYDDSCLSTFCFVYFYSLVYCKLRYYFL